MTIDRFNAKKKKMNASGSLRELLLFVYVDVCKILQNVKHCSELKKWHETSALTADGEMS